MNNKLIITILISLIISLGIITVWDNINNNSKQESSIPFPYADEYKISFEYPSSWEIYRSEDVLQYHPSGSESGKFIVLQFFDHVDSPYLDRFSAPVVESVLTTSTFEDTLGDISVQGKYQQFTDYDSIQKSLLIKTSPLPVCYTPFTFSENDCQVKDTAITFELIALDDNLYIEIYQDTLLHIIETIQPY